MVGTRLLARGLCQAHCLLLEILRALVVKGAKGNDLILVVRDEPTPRILWTNILINTFLWIPKITLVSKRVRHAREIIRKTQILLLGRNLLQQFKHCKLSLAFRNSDFFEVFIWFWSFRFRIFQ